MSRVGKKIIEIPQNTTVTYENSRVTAKGPLGELSVDLLDGIKVSIDGSVLAVVVDAPEEDYGKHAANHGLFRALVNNIIIGVSTGYAKDMEIQGVGYRVLAQGNDLKLQVGYSHDVIFPAPEGIAFEVVDVTNFKIKGIDKQQVGQVAADIRKIRPPEPYKGKGIRYKNEHVRRKAGKSGK